MASVPDVLINSIYSFVGNTRNGVRMAEGFGDVSKVQAICDFLVSKGFSLEMLFGRRPCSGSLEETHFHSERGTYIKLRVMGSKRETQFSLQKLLKLGIDPNELCFIGSYLEDAILSNDQLIVRCLLDATANPNLASGSAWPEKGNCVMHVAGKHSDDRIFALLLRAGGDPGVVNSLGITPMQYFQYSSLTLAARSGNVASAERILRQSLPAALLLHGPERYQSAYDAAASHGHVEMVRVLLQGGARPDENGSLHPVTRALMPSQLPGYPNTWSLPACVSIIQLLLDFGYSLDAPHCHVIGQAFAFRNWPEFKVLLRFLIHGGANPVDGIEDLRLFPGVTALIWSAIWARLAKRLTSLHIVAHSVSRQSPPHGSEAATATVDQSQVLDDRHDHLSNESSEVRDVQSEAGAEFEPAAVITQEEALNVRTASVPQEHDSLPFTRAPHSQGTEHGEDHQEASGADSKEPEAQHLDDSYVRMQVEEVQMQLIHQEQQDLQHALVRSKAEQVANRLKCLSLSNCSSWLTQNLLQSQHLRQCAARFDSPVQMQPPFSNGAILLFPVTEQEVQEAQWTLQPHNIVALEEDVQSLRQALADIKKRQGRPKVNVERALSTDALAGSSRPDTSNASMSSDENEVSLVVENTFLAYRSVETSSRRSKSA